MRGRGGRVSLETGWHCPEGQCGPGALRGDVGLELLRSGRSQGGLPRPKGATIAFGWECLSPWQGRGGGRHQQPPSLLLPGGSAGVPGS